MKNLLKYLIPILVVVTFCNVTGRSYSPCQEAPDCSLSIENHPFAESLSLPDADLSIPRQVSTCSTHHHGCVRKTSGVHAFPSLEMVKYGKELIINISIVEHSHKLVYLGKLII